MTETIEQRVTRTGKQWNKFGGQFGWKLFGWTFEYRASFLIEPENPRSEIIQITKNVKKTIQDSLNKLL